MTTTRLLTKIAVIGGTGHEGSGLAFRWANAGYEVVVGSRDPAKAQNAVQEINSLLGADKVIGMGNIDAATLGDIIVLTVPYSAHRGTLETIYMHCKGKLFVDVTVPLKPPRVDLVHIPEGRTAAEEAQEILGPEVLVVSAFQNVSATYLKNLSQEPDCDVLVTGNDPGAKSLVIKLVEAAGMRGIDAGDLANAIVAESLTAVLIAINKQYKVKGSGIRITGIG